MRYSRFEEVPVWRDAVELAKKVYMLTDGSSLRPSVRYQLERAALSISNNIAEGFERGTTQELLSFLYIARGSAGEVRSILCVAETLVSAPELRSQISRLKEQAESISRQLYGWVTQLKASPIKGQRRLARTPGDQSGPYATPGGSEASLQEDAALYMAGAEVCDGERWSGVDP